MATRNSTKPPRPLPLDEILFSQGFGSRRECLGLLRAGRVAVAGATVDDDAALFDPTGLVMCVDGVHWPVRQRALVLLHKPAGYECSQKPRHHPSVMSLLPVPLRQRGVQPVGRLDEETTGLLLLTDDGPLIHKLTHPKRHVPKLYRATTARPIEPGQITKLLAGVVLRDDPAPVRAVACERLGETELSLTLAEGRYHQARRMVAAVGNHVEHLTRVAFGSLALPADLPEGQWRWITPEEEAALVDPPLADKPA
ncbi:MAG: ribosomal small subunit pseudouridine synthase RsuA [Pseudomonadota bacterium]|jgi:16S rRNA pseudouridine516 synthase